MVHRTRTVNAVMTALWLALTAASALVAVLTDRPQHGIEVFPGAAGALFAGLVAGLSTGFGRLPEPGMVLATEAETRRVLWRRLWLYVPVTAALTVGAALLDRVWAVPALSLIPTVSGATAIVHVARWERRHPDVVLAQHLGWTNERRMRWLRAWGDRAPDVIPSEPANVGPPTWLDRVGFWPSKDPDDYR